MAAVLLFINITHVWAQVKSKSSKVTESRQLINFKRLADQAGVVFLLPDGFKELKAIDNENFSFDYAMTIPGLDFELWFEVKSLKQSWASYEGSKNISGRQLANPDSLYKEISHAHAMQLSGENKYFTRNLPARILEQYNADAGKTYLINLADSPETRHYKYGLLIALQKDHVGMVMAVCLTNDKGPEFFKNINQARNCIRFK